MNLYLDTLLFTSDIVVPIFFIVFLGFLLRRYRVIDDNFVNTASRLVFTITLPALVFMSISRTDFKAVFNPELLMLFIVFTLVCVAVLWWLTGRLNMPGNTRGVFIQGAFRGNFGIVGLAVCFNMFAEPGLAQASILLACVIPLYNVLSVLVLSLPHKDKQVSGGRIIKDIATNPLIIAVVLALPFSYYSWHLPVIGDAIGNYFASLTLPLALLAIGGSLNLKSLRNSSVAATWATTLKLLIFPITGTLIAWLCGFRGQDIGILMVLYGCPTAAASFVMAKAMQGDAQLAANIILTTTLGCVLTLSAGIYLLRLWQVI